MSGQIWSYSIGSHPFKNAAPDNDVHHKSISGKGQIHPEPEIDFEKIRPNRAA